MDAINLKLKDILSGASDLTWSDAVFTKKNEDFQFDSVCIVHDPDDVSDDELDLPDAVIAEGWVLPCGCRTDESLVAFDVRTLD